MTYPSHNPQPNQHPPGRTYYGSTPVHCYRIERRWGIRRARCWCGLSPCPDAEQEAAVREAQLHPRAVEDQP